MLQLKGKGTKRQTTIDKNYTVNKRLINTNPTKTGGKLVFTGRVSGSCTSQQNIPVKVLLTSDQPHDIINNPASCHSNDINTQSMVGKLI